MKKKQNESVLEEDLRRGIRVAKITLSKIVNAEQLEVLANSVSEIKRISIGIGQQVKDDNALLSDMERNILKGKELMIKTMNKLDAVLNSKSGNIIFYTIVFIVFVFMFLYKWTRS